MLVPMDERTLRFVIFMVFSALSLWAGYMLRKRGTLREDISRPIHYHTVIWLWSPVVLFSLWRIPLAADNLWFLVLQPLSMLMGGLGVIPLAKMLGCHRAQVGVLAVGAAQGNLGFTLGGYLCYCLLDPPEIALAYAIAMVSIMQAASVLIVYPLAQHYSLSTDDRLPFAKLVQQSLFDLRAMPLWSALAGIALAASQLPFPPFIMDYYLIDVLFYLGAWGGYFGIGLRLRLGDTFSQWKAHLLMAVMKFLIFPLATLLFVWLIHHTPLPLSELTHQVVMILAFMPGAIAMVMHANMFHLDARLSSQVWLINTIGFVVLPLPLILWWLT